MTAATSSEVTTSTADDARDAPAVERAPAITIRVQTFGACTVDVASNRLGRNADVIATLLLLLVHAPGMQMPRDTLVHALWPDSPEPKRRANLRQALYKLRQMGVRTTMRGEQVELDSAQVERNFSVERTGARFDADVLNGHDPFGTFLPTFQAAPNSTLADWLERERERAHADARRILAAALNTRHALADWRGAEPLARWLLQFDPLNEMATMVMAECLVLSGAKYEATRLLDHYLAEIGPGATDLRIPAATLRRRIGVATPRRISFAPTERHFIGRERVMADLTLGLRRARFNDGSATLLHGPAGMGKTRVVSELAKVAALEGIRDAHTGCRESDVTRPLSVFLDLVPELLAMPGALGCSPASMTALRRFTNADGAGGERVVNASGGLDMPLAAGLRRSIVDLITAVADEAPLLLAIEDVHWLDAASWEVLVDLVDRIGRARVCLLLTSRVAHARPVPPSRTPLGLSIQPLPPLTAECALELARAISTDLSAHIDDDLGTWFVETSEGVPLFLRTLVNHWIETGNAGGIPPTLQGIIGQRLQSLSADALRVLQTVSLLDRHAELAMLEAVLELPCYRVVNALDDLHTAGAFNADVGGRVVCHELIGRLAVDSLGRNARRALHKRIAEILRVKLETDRSPLVYRDRLGHLLQSGQTAHFLSASNDAVRDLLAAGFSYDALGIAEGALHHASDPEPREAVLTLQAEALYACGEYARLLGHPLSPSSVGQGLRRWHDAEPEALVRWLDSAFYADRGSNASDIGAAATLVSEEARYTSVVRYAAATLAIRVTSNTCDEGLAARAYAAGKQAATDLPKATQHLDELDVLYHTIFGDSRTARLAAERLLELTRGMRNIAERLNLQSIIAFALRAHGDIGQARATYQDMYNLAMKEKLPAKGSFAAWRLSSIALDADDLNLAIEWHERFESVAPIEREPLSAVLYHVHSARIAIVQQNASRAEFHAGVAAKTMDEQGHYKRYAHALGISLAIARLRNDHARLLDVLPEAQRVFRKVRSAVTQDFFASEIIHALVVIGRERSARRVLSDYLRLHRREAAEPTGNLKRAMVRIGIDLSTKFHSNGADRRAEKR